MIVAIQKGGFVKGLIEYHERKVSKGTAILLVDNTLSATGRERVSTFLDTAELNPRVKRNKFLHVSVSFNLEDRGVDGEKMIQIGQEYLAEMGITDTPVLMYEHQDKRHRHFHIVTTAITYAGTKVRDFNDHYRSQQLSRKLEKAFGLVPTTYESRAQQRLQELNASKYRILNSLPRLEQQEGALAELEKFLSAEDRAFIRNNALSDREIGERLGKRGFDKEAIPFIYRILTKHDLITRTYKEQLMTQLNQLKHLSRSREEFLERVEKAGIYVRKIATNNNQYSLTYGLADHNFYVKEKYLPTDLRYDYLFTGRKLEFDQAQQRRYVRRIVLRALRESPDREAFEFRLRENNIAVEYAENARGIYGVSFRSLNVKEGVLFKGSELDGALSWNQLQQSFGAPAAGDRERTTPSAPSVAPPRLDTLFEQPEDEDEKKRRKKDQDRDLEKD